MKPKKLRKIYKTVILLHRKYAVLVTRKEQRDTSRKLVMDMWDCLYGGKE